MSPLKEVRYTSRSITPPPKRRSSSISPPRARARSRSRSQDPGYASNPGNNLYITGLSTRVTTSDLEEHFSKEGKVRECEVVLDPRSRESRGFAFITMESVEDADRCIKHLNRSVLEGRLITVEKAKRKCGRTPTPGHYYGSRDRRGVYIGLCCTSQKHMVDVGGLAATLHIDRVKESIRILGDEGKDPDHHTIRILGEEGKDPDLQILGAEGKDPDHHMQRIQTEGVGSMARSVPCQLPAMETIIDQTRIHD
ncbi:serine/arginine-rich splicing factor SR45a-like [Iris pallida]|uniref:Serine/arginine-rich splicing factor SR45a-like n=1 Tax=Iris pallida TaxID=29817 RepID=A0AAX6EM92_IRIPA|nr:serine/arginine-rich splicing factor SR45a-like [Iris pallida]